MVHHVVLSFHFRRLNWTREDLWCHRFCFHRTLTGYEPKPKLKLKKKSISQNSGATPINNPDLDNFSHSSRVTRESTGRFGVSDACVDPSCGSGQFRETESSDPLFSHVSCVGDNVLSGLNRLRETECRQREREDRENSSSVISVDESPDSA